MESFRYGRVMFMADQDYDGSHIKGLLINFFYMLSPSLLRIPYFLSELITPIIRAFHCNGIQKLSFYSYPEYEKWWKNWGNSDWRIKYYKGLGSFTHEEGKEFFQNVEIQRKYFVWRNDEDGDAINIAFSKSKTRERRGLLLKFKSSDYRDYTDLSNCYKDFLQKEFILYSMASVRRCIPSLIDGQKPSQRKILYGAFKRELFTEIRVDKLIGYVAEHSAYHHDESSLATTLMRMARDYVGSMNINLLMANSQFGTRNQGGNDHASPRYIYTELNPISRFLFPEIYNKLLKYLNEDGISVEPEWYLPIIPLVLVNGASGIATGWNCSIPCYNPKDIIANIKRFLNDDKLQPMVPWYKGFKGTIDKSRGGEYVVSGKVEVIDDQSFRITELPVGTWTKKYLKFLKDHPLIEAFWQNGDNSMVDIKVKLKLQTKMTEKELLVKFKLISKIPRSRMYLFNRNARIQKYDSPEQILQEFCKYRFECYDMRTAPSVRQLKDQVRFISEVVSNKIVLSKNMSKAELVLKLKGNGFKPLSQKGENVGGAKNYEHLLPMCTLAFESLKKLQAEKEKELDNLMRADLWAYKKNKSKDLWLEDLLELEKKLNVGEGMSRNLHFPEQLLDYSHIEEYMLCTKLKVTLRSYQQQGINWLAFLKRSKLHGILCDDMGLGKTLQASAIVASDIAEHQGNGDLLPSLIICPSTLVGHWAFEIEKYIEDPVISSLQYVGSARMLLRANLCEYNVIITSYDVVRQDIQYLGKLLWNYCILDEGHIIQNAKSKVTLAVKQLKAQHRLILSGTPIQNNIMDLWSLFDFLMPGFLGAERQFQGTYGKPLLAARDPKRSAKDAEAGALAMKALHKQVVPFLLRRTKDEVLSDLPDRIIHDIYCNLGDVQRKLYEQFSDSPAKQEMSSVVTTNEPAAAEGSSHTTKAASHVFQALQYLLKLCSHPLLVDREILDSIPGGSDANLELGNLRHSPKLGALFEILKESGIGVDASGSEAAVNGGQHKVLIFAQHKAFLDIIEECLFQTHMKNVKYLRLDGSNELETHFKIVQDFNSDPNINVLLLTTHVGGFGLNLTSADTFVFVEHDWNPMRDHQAMGKAHRLGQEKVVNVHRLIMRETLEEQVMSKERFEVSVTNAANNLRLLSAKSSVDHSDGVTELVGSGALVDPWDQSHYTDESNLDQFLAKLKALHISPKRKTPNFDTGIEESEV